MDICWEMMEEGTNRNFHFGHKHLDGRPVTTGFEALGEKTKVTTTFDAEKENSEEMQKNGWQAILNSFKKYTEEN